MTTRFAIPGLWRGGLAGCFCALALAAVASNRPEAPEAVATRTDWPMFRGGPGLLGVSPASLPSALQLRWSAKTGGPVKSSPAIADGRVFVGSDDGHLHAFSLAEGKAAWTFKTEGPIESSPLVAAGRVYIGSSDGALYAVDAATGKQVWKYTTEDRILGAPNWVRSPDGKALWILAGSYDFKLHCVDAATGKKVWEFESGDYINGSPAVSEGRTVFGGCDALLHIIDLADGKQVKEVEAGSQVAGSVALFKGRAYFGHYGNEYLCVDVDLGQKAWTYKDRNFPYFSSPALTDDRLVFGGRDKRLHCVNRENGEAVWTFNTQGRVRLGGRAALPRVAEGREGTVEL
jgi:eukaryotic-like serine/threonine-protein kinase